MAERQRIFVHEFIAGGGLLDQPHPPSGSLLREGLAMMRAIVADFRACPDVDVITTLDYRLVDQLGTKFSCEIVHTPGEERATFDRLASSCDWTLVIAPELDGLLLERTQRVVEVDGRVLGPNPDYIRTAACKLTASRTLLEAGIPTAVTCRHDVAQEVFADHEGPFVVKPSDGAGSQDICVVRSLNEIPGVANPKSCVQPLVSGIDYSVSLMVGGEQTHAMPTCGQHLSADGRLRYLGGTCPCDATASGSLDVRAKTLAKSAARALGEPFGYLGVDLVLSACGTRDMVIEVNPRLTTSYVGLREIADSNLAGVLLEVATGQRSTIQWSDRSVRFDPSGNVEITEANAARP